ncbi:flagellar basal-body MS-ring/collar protein FliF [Aquicoccus sp. G2-2]|uniref:flagellar basal-body MS-ring/collar protein FliF n=1 Tax=Aquicoccus sp. G2-2 TaxID=3092120 RepID=UPI002AE077B3|nr:flagellar basal-body MS-ring/collar protein FliF [Aquicoccus sp. G2-2]MEA1114391.1 flagellar basal-body MS-ring/collar protein FliF [Aquicoccus sp. G2-2]
MQQIQNVWSSLDTRRRLIALLAAGVVFAAVLTMTRMAAQPSLSLLYSGLENGAAGEVVEALERRGVPYEVRGGTIFVDATKRDELRMTLASEGLPMNSAKGYELLDSLSGFGTTSQMFDAAYWRAKEGELARTIISSPLIANARVHIANIGSNPFQRNLKSGASVSVMAVNGSVSASEAKALKYLVASAVAGLSPDDVSVIDSKGGLVASGDEATQDAIGKNRADTLRARVRNMLEALVGNGNAVVEVSVETETESESIHEKHFDPAGRVAVSTETEERSNKSTESGKGDVTVASNLPQGDAAKGDSAANQGSQTRERVNYEVSETRREVIRQPGAIKRLSVAVLVNGISGTDASGATIVTPRPDEELAALRELVASAVGYDEARGDVITIKSMAFEPVAEIGTAPGPGWFSALHLNVMSVIQMAVLAIVALVLGLFVLRPLLSRPAGAELPALAPPKGSATAAAATGAPEPLTGEISDGPGDFSALPVISDAGTSATVAGVSGGGRWRPLPIGCAI